MNKLTALKCACALQSHMIPQTDDVEELLTFYNRRKASLRTFLGK